MFSPLWAQQFKSSGQSSGRSPGHFIRVLAIGCGFTSEESCMEWVLESLFLSIQGGKLEVTCSE